MISEISKNNTKGNHKIQNEDSNGNHAKSKGTVAKKPTPTIAGMK